jgi:hypothetical protein
MVLKDFTGLGPYPTYVLQTILMLAVTTTNLFPAIAPNTSMSPIVRPSPSVPAEIYIAAPSIATNPTSAYITPTIAPDTPELCPEPYYSDTTLSTSSASPPTPTGMVDNDVKIVSHDTPLRACR